jgi:hypothetical protein
VAEGIELLAQLTASARSQSSHFAALRATLDERAAGPGSSPTSAPVARRGDAAPSEAADMTLSHDTVPRHEGHPTP